MYINHRFLVNVLMVVILSPSLDYALRVAIDNTSALDLIILHNNDMHARFEQTDKFSEKCSEENAQAGACYGGFARVSSIIKSYRNGAKKGNSAVLYLNAGDTYFGTPWFSLFEHKIASDLMNMLKPDAMVTPKHTTSCDTLIIGVSDVDGFIQIKYV